MNRLTAIFFTDGGDIGVQCARILAQHPVRVTGVVVSSWPHEDEANRYDYEIERLFGFPGQHNGGEQEGSVLANVACADGVDFLFSCWYDKRIAPEILAKVRRAAVNLHPAYLPYNRGRHSAFWGIYIGTPLGATIHHMDANFDTGDIIAQMRIEDDGIIPASEVYARQNAACVQLFRDWLPRILDGTAPRMPQGKGEYHHAREIAAMTRLDAKDSLTMGEAVRLARATCVPGHGFYVRLSDGRNVKVQATVTLA